MDAKDKLLVEFLRDTQQFLVPIYQRSYSWNIKQCEQLIEDIEKISDSNNSQTHFIGSIVRVKDVTSNSEISQHLIIDGQQRITTILLLIAAIIKASADKNRVEELQELYLINRHGKNELRYKMLLTEQDKKSLIDIIDNSPNATIRSNSIKNNFEYFMGIVETKDPEEILKGIRRLMIVDISLDADRDNPQLIFESLNSTGLKLSQADLIRNYVLMGLEKSQQEKLHKNYWSSMEQSFGQNNYMLLFDRFMRDYLTIKIGVIPNLGDIYTTFKDYYRKNDGANNTEIIISDLNKYAKYYVDIATGEETNKKLNIAFSHISDLKVDVCYPFMLNVYDDFKNNKITEDDFLYIISLIESYVFRRFICNIPTNSLNKTFANLYKNIDKENYVESLKATFIKLDNYQRFPKDHEFLKCLYEKDVYNTKSRNFWLNRIENYERKEFVKIEEYTIEHIMPQTLSEHWKKELGENWETIHSQYLNTIGNITLTGYNSELSNKTFSEKQATKGGFKNSPLNLNESLQNIDKWNENSIKERIEKLSKVMLKIWSGIDLPQAVLEKYKTKNTKKDIVYSIEDHKFLNSEPTKSLFDILRKRIMNLDVSIEEHFLKLYIAYKAPKNFIDIIPLKTSLKIYLSMNYEYVHDPKNMCQDDSNVGKWGNGNIRVDFSSNEELEDVMLLIKQSFEYNYED